MGAQMTGRRTLPNRRSHEIFEFEHAGIGYVAGVGRFGDGSLAEIFIDAAKPGSHSEIAARDAAVVCSIALQFGVPVEVIRHAVTRIANGEAAGPLGRALDEIGGESQ